jgi:acyl carrier protein
VRESANLEIRRLLATVAGNEVVDSIGDEDLFFEERVIDSLHLVEIIDLFGSQLGVEVTGEDLSPENFGSIARMSRFLASKRETAETEIG